MDRGLVERAQRGDREAFGVLARTSGDLLFAIAIPLAVGKARRQVG
jgi:hypothetical protein